MFAYHQIEPNTVGTVSHWDVPANTWMGLKFGAAREQTMGRSISRMTEDWLEDGPMLSPEEANAKFGVAGEGGLQFREPVKAGRAALMRERKIAELERLSYFEAAEHSWFSGKAAAGFGAALVGSMSHPLDLGISFIPLFGQSAKAQQLAKIGAGAFRQRMARGLIATEDDLVRAGVPLPRVTASVVEGMVGNVIAEVPVFLQASRDQAVYGIEDSFINIVAGGAFAGALRGLGRALEKAADLYFRLDDRIKAEVETKAMSDFLNDRPIDVDRIVRVDEAAIRERVRFDEQAARQEVEAAETIELAKQELRDVGVPDDVIESSARDIDAAARSGEPVTREAVIDRVTTTLREQGTPEITIEALKVGLQKRIDRAELERELAEELGGDVARAPRVEAEREARIRDYVEAKRKDWNEEAKFQEEVKRETARQQAEGKILSDEIVDSFTFKSDMEEGDIAALTEDISTLQKDLEAGGRELSEAEQKALKEVPEMNEKTFRAAVPCVLDNLMKE